MDPYDNILAEKAQTQGDDFYDQFFAQQSNTQNHILNGVVDQAITINPSQAAKTQSLSKSIGLPTDVVSRNQDVIDNLDKLRKIKTTLQQSPVLSQKMADPSFAEVAHQDTEKLGAMENVLNSWNTVPYVENLPRSEIAKSIVSYGRSFGSGMNAANLGLSRAFGGVFVLADKLASIFKGKDKHDAANWWLENQIIPLEIRQEQLSPRPGASVPEKAAEIAGNLTSLLAQIALTGGTAEAPAIANTTAQFARQAIEHATKTMAFPALTSAVNTGNDVYQQTNDSEKALNAAIMEYATNTGIGLVPLSAPGTLAKRLTTGFVSGALIGEGSRVAMNAVLPEQTPFSFENLLISGLTGSVLGGVMGPRPQPAYHQALRDLYDAASKSEQAVQDAQLLEQLQTLASETNLHDISPDTLQSFMQSASANGRAKDLYVDARTLYEMLKGPEKANILKRFPDLAARANEGIVQGGDVKITLPEFISKLSKTQLGKDLLPELKTAPDAYTLKESEAFTRHQEDIIIQQAMDAVSKHQEDKAWTDSAKKVEESIYNELEATKRFSSDVNESYAKLVSSFFVTTANRLGITPEEMYQRYQLRTTAEGVPGAQQLEQGRDKLDDVLQKWTDAGISHNVSEKNGIITLNKIVVPAEDRQTGKGTAAMRSLVDYADRTGQRITLTPSSDFGGNKKRLIKFYKRFGFVENKGKNKDFSTMELMIREPKTEVDKFFQPANILTQEEVAAKLGISVSEVTPEEYQNAIRSQLRAREDLFSTVGGRRPAQGWTEATRVRRKTGEPATVYRGAATGLSESSFQTERLGGASKNPSSGLGVWFTPHQAEAARYGTAEPFQLDIRNPKIIKVEDLPAFDTVADATKFRENLRKQGYDGIVIEARHLKGPVHFVAFDPQQVIRERAFAQGEPSGQRGTFTFAPDITRTPSVISLLKNADLSTFLHETGHFQLEVMADIASRADAPVEIQNDMKTALDWFKPGMTLEQWRDMSLEERRPYHEQFARGFEKYLLEGTAPSLALRDLFRRFRSWLLNVYRSLSSLNVELTDEVRSVFDRMLASDAAIQSAKGKYIPMMGAKPEGMPETEWASYHANQASQVAKAEDTLNTRSLGNLKWLENAKSKALRDLQRTSKVKRTAIREEISAEVMSDPIYQARQFLTDGTLPETKFNQKQRRILEEAGISGQKLSLPILKEMYGDGPAAIWRYLPTGKKGIAVAEGGMDPDAIAMVFGFKSGDEMVRKLAEAPAPRDVINELTDQRMLERYGELVDPESLQRAAEEAIHNEFRARTIAIEMKAMNESLGSKRDLIVAAKRYAQDFLAKQTVDDIKYQRYVAAEEKSSRLAEQAFKKGDTRQAAEYKRAELINNALAKEALAIQSEIDKTISDYNKLSRNKNVRKKMRGDFLEQLDDLLARFDFRKSITKKERQALKDWIDQVAIENSAIKPEIDPKWLNENYRKHYKDMTLEEFRGLKDTVDQIQRLARREQEMYLAIRNQNFQQERDAILSELSKVHPEAFDAEGKPKGFEKPYSPNLAHKLKRGVEKFDAEFLNLENLTQILTGGKFGALHESIVQRLSDRADWKISKTIELGKYLKPFLDAYSLREKARFGKRAIRIDAINDSLTKEQILTTALYYGNAEGRQRLQDGHGWGERQINAILSHMEAKDWNLANALWRMMDEMVWPDLEALNKRTTGSSPPKVEAISFAEGKARGGYWPLVYDADLNYRQQKYDLGSSVEDMLGGGIWGARTRQGTSMQRLQEVNKRLVLDFSGMNAKLGETLHDIAFREAVADTYRIMTDEGVRRAIDGIYGPDISKTLERRIREVAATPYSPQSRSERMLSKLRQNSLMAIMGFSVKTALINFTGLIPAATRVPINRLVREVTHFANPAETGKVWKEVMGKSEYMRNRSHDFDRDIHQAVQQITVKRKLMPDMATAMSLISLMDRAVAVPVWKSAYHEAINGRVKDIQVGDENAAIRYADHIVRQTQGSGRTVDLATIQTGGEAWKLMTMFYSYFNAQLGVIARSAHLNYEQGGGMAAAKFAADFAFVVLLPAIVSAILYGRVGTEHPVKDVTRETLLYNAGFFPIFRDVAVAAWNYADPDAYHFGYRMSPVGSALDAMAQTPSAIINVAEGEPKPADARRIVMGVAYATGLPGAQVWRSYQHLEHVYDGEKDFNPWYLFMGEPPKEK